MNKLIISTVLLIIIFSCTQVEKKVKDVDSTTMNNGELAEGFSLTEKSCFSCHSPNAATIDNRIAPPMEAIKKHYITSNTTQAEFTKELINFLNNPTVENSKMPSAVQKFNLMPKMNFSGDEITKIATYIYNTELEKPDWFEKHYNEEKQKYSTAMNENKSPLEIGQSLAMQTKSVLGKNLLQAINTNGTENALSFCSTKAIPLTDSMALVLNTKIKRVSDKNRNPINQANARELDYINKSKDLITKKMPVKPMLTTMEGKNIGYYPIMTNKMCMQCHGKLKIDINTNTLTKIQNIYPYDKAIGYKENELRGIWVIEMDREITEHTIE